MRLTSAQARIIRETIAEMLGSDAHVRLFGSRADDKERGGDIDLYIEVKHVLDNRVAAASRLAGQLQLRLGDQRIDVVLVDPATAPRPIHAAARSEGIDL